MNFLVITAHPDDEVLGAGATIPRLISEGHRVAVAIMSANAEARAIGTDTLAGDMSRAMAILGVKKVYPHLALVQFAESCIRDWQADAIITHHPTDTNIDHRETAAAVNAACRLFQRTEGVPPLKELLYMEIPSSTEWNLDSSGHPFRPNTYVAVGREGLARKLEALRAYSGVMRPYPHPRSEEASTGLAACRGAEAGIVYAEAFECAFRSIV